MESLNFFKKKKKILITGCGRSGTNYTAEILKKCGIEVEHEKEGKDGIVSWCMAVEDEYAPFGPSSSKYDFDHIFHQVRNPIDVISSAQTISEKSWEYIIKHIPINNEDSLVIKCSKYWYYWNLEAEKRANMTYKLEDFGKILPEIIRVVGRGDLNMDGIKKQPKNINSRKHSKISLYDIKKEDDDLFNKIILLALKYGYNEKDIGIDG